MKSEDPVNFCMAPSSGPVCYLEVFRTSWCRTVISLPLFCLKGRNTRR